MIAFAPPPTEELIVTEPLRYATSGIAPGIQFRGAGQHRTIIRSRVKNGPAILLDGCGDTAGRQEGGILSGLSIIADLPDCGPAIECQGQWHLTLENIHIDRNGPNRFADGIVLRGGSDPRSCAHVEIRHCDIYGCAGWGIRGELVPTPGVPSYAGLSFVTVDGCRVGQNGAGGVVMPAFWVTIRGGSLYRNGGHGLLVHAGGSSDTRIVRTGVRVEDVEFETNTQAQLAIDCGINISVSGNRFLVRATDGSNVAATLGVNPEAGMYAGIVQGLTFGPNEFSATPSGNPQAVVLQRTVEDAAIVGRHIPRGKGAVVRVVDRRVRAA